ncbi:ABC transporter permease [Telmatobacter sp. DSM 110680]|uniref:ABC transporter permease n=1 Tax=Telmatobacter sp. DSM 110680 TaxID=3036704 RepID=A0AAU7DQ56_9BACT
MSVLLQDIRYSLRMLLKSRGFSAIAILTLSLGIGANTTLFSVVNGVLLNPLPYPQSSQLVAIHEKNAGMNRSPISYPNFLDWERANQTFSSMAIYRHEDYNLTGTAKPERINGLMVSAGFFATLGLQPILGRTFNRDYDHPGASPVVLVSAGLWNRRFAASTSVVGQSIELNGTTYAIIGVLPPGFAFYGIDRDVFTPIGQWTDPSFLDRRVDMSAHAVGRLKPGVTLVQARSDMDGIAHTLAINYPEADKDVGISLFTMKDDIVGDVQPLLLVLLGAVGFVLLIACANVASLLLARATRRSGEFALRAALGASRVRVIRQLLTESILLSAIGGTFGLLLALIGTHTVVTLLPAALPRTTEISLDTRVLIFTFSISLLCGILFGLLPALKSSRKNLQQMLRQSTQGAGGARHRLQGVMVVVEVSMALVLLIGAGLMLRSLAALWRVNPGYIPDHAITFSLSLPTTAKTTSAETRARLRHFDSAISAIPGVEAVSVTLGSRPIIHDSELPFWIDGQPKPANDNDMPQAMFYLVESGFHHAMGINLERGRFVSPHDDENAPVVVDIDDVFARTYFPNQNPVGQHIHIAEFDVEAEIVGVVGHVKQWGPGNDARSPVQAEFYYPFMQLPPKLMALVANGVAVVIRTHDDPSAVMVPVRRAVSELDPGAVIYSVQTMNEVLSNSLAPRRLSMILLAGFAVLALAMSCVGIFAVTSYLVGERTREIGVRMALGAQRADVLRLVVGQGTRTVLLGIFIGIAAALILTRLIGNQLYGISAHDPFTFAGVAIVLTVVAVFACYIPARRATRIDPVVALRSE